MVLETAGSFKTMRRVGAVVGDLLKVMGKEAKPGISTNELDRIAEKFIRSQGALPAFKGYHNYPATICASPNETVIHGIPNDRLLEDGDILGVDVGAVVDGYYADAARTFAIGVIDKASEHLIEVTRRSLDLAIAKAVAGNYLGDIGWAVQEYAEKEGLSVVRQYVGHGIGRNLHEEPQVPNVGKPNHGLELVEGMALAIEPMLNLGSYQVETLSDGWTVVTKDRKRSAHFEQTVIVGRDRAEILTN